MQVGSRAQVFVMASTGKAREDRVKIYGRLLLNKFQCVQGCRDCFELSGVWPVGDIRAKDKWFNQ